MAKIQKSFVFIAFDATLSATKMIENVLELAKNLAKN